MEENMVGKDVWKWKDGVRLLCMEEEKVKGWYEGQRMEEEKACSLPNHVGTFQYCASNSDHEHGYESGMNKGYGREGMKKGVMI